MLEVADIFRLHGAAYCAQLADRLPASQGQAMQDIQNCRTAYLGGHLKQCDHCGQKVIYWPVPAARAPPRLREGALLRHLEPLE
ncbi:MAG TPA: transposase zinc-binding domain-containing protein [Acidobacteriota bacterium]|jgi:hypothetical protein